MPDDRTSSAPLRIWIVEIRTSEGWVPRPVWATCDRAGALGTIAGLVKNANYNRRHLRARAWVRQ